MVDISKWVAADICKGIGATCEANGVAFKISTRSLIVGPIPVLEQSRLGLVVLTGVAQSDRYRPGRRCHTEGHILPLPNDSLTGVRGKARAVQVVRVQVTDHPIDDLRQRATLVIPDVFLQRCASRGGFRQQVVVGAVVEQRGSALDCLLRPVAIEAEGVLAEEVAARARSDHAPGLVVLEGQAVERQGVAGCIQIDRPGWTAHHPVRVRLIGIEPTAVAFPVAVGVPHEVQGAIAAVDAVEPVVGEGAASERGDIPVRVVAVGPAVDGAGSPGGQAALDVVGPGIHQAVAVGLAGEQAIGPVRPAADDVPATGGDRRDLAQAVAGIADDSPTGVGDAGQLVCRRPEGRGGTDRPGKKEKG